MSIYSFISYAFIYLSAVVMTIIVIETVWVSGKVTRLCVCGVQEKASLASTGTCFHSWNSSRTSRCWRSTAGCLPVFRRTLRPFHFHFRLPTSPTSRTPSCRRWRHCATTPPRHFAFTRTWRTHSRDDTCTPSPTTDRRRTVHFKLQRTTPFPELPRQAIGPIHFLSFHPTFDENLITGSSINASIANDVIFFLWRPLLPSEYSYKPSCARPG